MAQFDTSSLIGLLVVLIILSQAIRIVREYERVVIFQLGRFRGVMISAEMIRVVEEHMEKNG